MRGKDIIVKRWRNLPPANRWVLVGFVAVLSPLLLAIYFYFGVYTSSDRTFWAMIDNNLSTSSVVKKTSQSNGSATVTSFFGITYNNRPALHSIRKIVDGSTTPTSKLTLEAIGTEAADYQRYSNIERRAPNGKLLDFSEVYNIWLETSSNNRPPTQLTSNLFGPMLFGNLNQSQRDEVISLLKQAYRPTFVGQTNQDGRRVYWYSLKVEMRKYAEAIQKYIKLNGIKASAVSPQAYKKDDIVSLSIKVDVRSRHLLESDNTANGGVKEEYLSYGIKRDVQKPSKISTVADLQKAIESASNP